MSEKASKELISQQIDWLFQTLNDFSGSGELTHYLQSHFQFADIDDLQMRVIRAIRSGKCPAQTKPQFVRWAKRLVDRTGESLLPFLLANRTKQQRGKLSLSDVIGIAALHNHTRKGAAPFPSTVQNGNTALIDLGSGILKVPACPDSDDPIENFLPILQLLWPFHIRGGKVFKHVDRQLYRSGQWHSQPYRLPLHRLFLSFQDNNPRNDGRIVRARDGDFLNWTYGNLYFTDREVEFVTVGEEWMLGGQPAAAHTIPEELS